MSALRARIESQLITQQCLEAGGDEYALLSTSSGELAALLRTPDAGLMAAMEVTCGQYPVLVLDLAADEWRSLSLETLGVYYQCVGMVLENHGGGTEAEWNRLAAVEQYLNSVVRHG